jgi:hypothetical protein
VPTLHVFVFVKTQCGPFVEQIRNLVRIKPARLRLLRWRDVVPTLLIMSSDTDEETRARAGEALETVWRNATLDAGDLGEGKSLLEQDTALDVTETICTISEAEGAAAFSDACLRPTAPPPPPWGETLPVPRSEMLPVDADRHDVANTTSDTPPRASSASRASHRSPMAHRPSPLASPSDVLSVPNSADARTPLNSTGSGAVRVGTRPEEGADGTGPGAAHQAEGAHTADSGQYMLNQQSRRIALHSGGIEQLPRNSRQQEPHKSKRFIRTNHVPPLLSPEGNRGHELEGDKGSSQEELLWEKPSRDDLGIRGKHGTFDRQAASVLHSHGTPQGRPKLLETSRPERAGAGSASTAAELGGAGEASPDGLFGDAEWPAGLAGADSSTCGLSESRMFLYLFDSECGFEATVTADGELVDMASPQNDGDAAADEAAEARAADTADRRHARAETQRVWGEVGVATRMAENGMDTRMAPRGEGAESGGQGRRYPGAGGAGEPRYPGAPAAHVGADAGEPSAGFRSATSATGHWLAATGKVDSEGVGSCLFEEELRPLFEAIAAADDPGYAAFSTAALRRALLRPARVLLPSTAAARSAADSAVGLGLRALLRWARTGFDGNGGAVRDALEAVDAVVGRLPEGNMRLRRAAAADPATVQVRFPDQRERAGVSARAPEDRKGGRWAGRRAHVLSR